MTGVVPSSLMLICVLGAFRHCKKVQAGAAFSTVGPRTIQTSHEGLCGPKAQIQDSGWDLRMHLPQNLAVKTYERPAPRATVLAFHWTCGVSSVEVPTQARNTRFWAGKLYPE